MDILKQNPMLSEGFYIQTCYRQWLLDKVLEGYTFWKIAEILGRPLVQVERDFERYCK